MSLDDEMEAASSEELNPEVLMLQNIKIELLRDALNGLPAGFREVIIKPGM
jgi:DNA-directed RNA polymerase specialized sigma24 family protein